MTIDFSFITNSGFSNPFSVTWWLISHGGWIVLLYAAIHGGLALFVYWKRNQYLASIEYVVLAIDVPKITEQTPKAVESVFAHIHGVQSRGHFKKRFLEGYIQTQMSFEIISIGGYIQFIIRTPVKYRDLVESAFYAQYPDVEISEVEDYVGKYKPVFPNEAYDIWGADIKLAKPDYYPIRTYPMFEHVMTQQLLDPIASLLEFMSRMRPGEELWIQMLITPPDNDSWLQGARRIIRKLAHVTFGGKKGGGLADNVGWLPSQVLRGLTESFSGNLISPFGGEVKEEKREQPSLMSFLPPDERETITQIAYKAAKLYFESKIRIIYVSEKEAFDKSRVPGVMGALKQLTSLDTNGFIVDKKTKTTVDYFRVEARQNARKRKILRAFQERDMDVGTSLYTLNVEELATVFHFPVATVKAPLVQKTEARKGEPPSTLPIEAPFTRIRQKTDAGGPTPTNLPT